MTIGMMSITSVRRIGDRVIISLIILVMPLPRISLLAPSLSLPSAFQILYVASRILTLIHVIHTGLGIRRVGDVVVAVVIVIPIVNIFYMCSAVTIATPTKYNIGSTADIASIADNTTAMASTTTITTPPLILLLQHCW